MNITLPLKPGHLISMFHNYGSGVVTKVNYERDKAIVLFDGELYPFTISEGLERRITTEEAEELHKRFLAQ